MLEILAIGTQLGFYLLVGAFCVWVYFFPAWIAGIGDAPASKKKAIFWTNLFLGWTGVIWVILFLWCFFGNSRNKH